MNIIPAVASGLLGTFTIWTAWLSGSWHGRRATIRPAILLEPEPSAWHPASGALCGARQAMAQPAPSETYAEIDWLIVQAERRFGTL